MPDDPIERQIWKQEKAEKDARRTEYALKRWNESERLPTLAYDYFHARGIHELPPNVDEVLRWHPDCPMGGWGQCPLMIALYRHVKTNEPVAILRNWLTDWEPHNASAERMSLGPIRNAAIQLWPLDDIGRLVIGEGLETTLSGAAMTWRGTPLRPAWAATVANNVKHLPLVKGVRQLIVLADNDAQGTGEAAAEAAYHRYRDAGRDAFILKTKHVKDFNDLARGRSHA
jgi:putative DNA primase/helicase